MRKIEDYDRSIHYNSQVCDDVIRSNADLKENVDDVKSKVDYLLKQQAEINIKQSNTDEKLIDIQWRSLRENLIFTGIAERRDLARVNGPRQANLLLIAYASSEGSGEPAHPRSLARTSAARS